MERAYTDRVESDRIDGAELRERFFAQLDPAVDDAVRRIIDAGPADVYVVGGVVRDLLLDRLITDIDLVCEVEAVARVQAALPGDQITTHARFRTASVTAEGVRIDVATARRETYERPGSLPIVEPADIGDDLKRRDFSVNAIALRITGDPALLDPCGGSADIRDRCIRVLHDSSFRDDPTRVFRAFRYAARLGFEIEAHTLALLRDSVRYIADVSGSRVHRELELMLGEATGGVALEMADDAGALRAIHGGLSWDQRRTAALGAAADVPLPALGFGLLTVGATIPEAEAVTERLRLKHDEAAAVTGLASMQTTAATLRRSEAKPSGVTVLLDRYPVASVAAFAATTDDAIAGQLAGRYLAEWRLVRPLLRGDDLMALGVPEGPQIQRGLQLIRAARLDGWAEDEGDERALALRFAKSIRDSSIMHSDVELHVNGH